MGPKTRSGLTKLLPFKSVNHRNPMVRPRLSQKRHLRTMVLSLKLKLDKPSFDDSHRELSPSHNEVLITKKACSTRDELIKHLVGTTNSRRSQPQTASSYEHI